MTVPFPALTPSQRLHLEVNGYVVVEGVPGAGEVEALRETTYEIERRHRETGELPGPSCHLSATREDFFRVDNLPHLAPCYFDYLTHPRLLGMVQEIVGGTVRLEQSDAHIRRPVPEAEQRYGFHRGINPGFTHTDRGLYHFSFVKTLTNLTDLGPDDGGTAVIAGSHKLNCGEDDMVGAAYDDPALVHQVAAPAGSTLVMCETLIHATGQNRGEKERAIVIGGYSHPKDMAMAGRLSPMQPTLGLVPCAASP